MKDPRAGVEIVIYDIDTNETFDEIQRPEPANKAPTTVIRTNLDRNFGIKVILLENFDFRGAPDVMITYKLDDGAPDVSHYISKAENGPLPIQDSLDVPVRSLGSAWITHQFVFWEPQTGILVS